MKRFIHFLLILPLFFACADLADDAETKDPLSYSPYNSELGHCVVVTDCRKDAKTVIIPEVIQIRNIPYTVTAIYTATFLDHTNLQSVVIPPTINEIGDEAFKGCTRLKTVTVPGGATLGKGAFKGSGLVSIELGEGLTTIPNQCFSECSSLSTVTIPSTVKNIKYLAFSGCTGLKEITDLAREPQSLGSGAWPEGRLNATLHIPAGCRAAYEKWSFYFRNIVEDAE